jgi:hypothetical protein
MRLLGIVNSKQIKNVVPLGHGNHYLLDAETGNNVLRPNWNSSFATNSDWHQDAINFIRTKGPHFHPAPKKLTLQSQTNDEILKQLAAIFKTLACAYGKSADDPEVLAAKKVVHRMARRTQRKIKVSTFSVVPQNAIPTPENQTAQDHQDVHPESTMRELAWDFLFEVIYQSSDETDSQDDVDPDTDTSASNELKVNAVSQDWVT